MAAFSFIFLYFDGLLYYISKPWNLVWLFCFSVALPFAYIKMRFRAIKYCASWLNGIAESKSHCEDHQWFRNGCNKVGIEPCVVQFWSEITLVITNGTRTARLFDFKISHMTHITLTHLSCSPNFPRALYLDERTLTYEPIVNYLALSSISSISFLSFFLLLSRFWSFRYQHLVNFMRMVLRTKPLTLNVILMPLRNHKDRVLKLI